jgi:hypothetical protein
VDRYTWSRDIDIHYISFRFKLPARIAMKVAIAGTNGLACWIAHFLADDGHHPFIMISRAVKHL